MYLKDDYIHSYSMKNKPFYSNIKDVGFGWMPDIQAKRRYAGQNTD
jgi:hypothetical protein